MQKGLKRTFLKRLCFFYSIKETKTLEENWGCYVEEKRIKATVGVEENKRKISAWIEMIFSISWKNPECVTI